MENAGRAFQCSKESLLAAIILEDMISEKETKDLTTHILERFKEYMLKRIYSITTVKPLPETTKIVFCLHKPE